MACLYSLASLEDGEQCLLIFPIKWFVLVKLIPYI
jgi:hypothetical protein